MSKDLKEITETEWKYLEEENPRPRYSKCQGLCELALCVLSAAKRPLRLMRNKLGGELWGMRSEMWETTLSRTLKAIIRTFALMLSRRSEATGGFKVGEWPHLT